MSAYPKLFLILLISSLLIQPANSLAQTAPELRLTFDKTFYNRSESFSATGTLTNPTDKTLRLANITLSILPALEPGEPLSQAFVDPGPPIIHQKWSKALPPGATHVNLKRDLPTLDFDEGVYPAEISLKLTNNQTFIDHSFLVVIDPKDQPVSVALVWNLHQAEHRLPNGVFIDNALADLVENKPENQGLLRKQLNVLAEHPTIKVNLALSPILGEQLASMASGYSWRNDRRSKKAGADSEQALAAADWLDSLKNSYNSGQVEIMTSPYGQASLPFLASRGWQDSGTQQLELAKTTSQKILSMDKSPPGLYAPGLLIDKKSATWLLRSKYKYAVALADPSSSSSHTAKPLAPFVFKKNSRALTIFSSDQEIADWITTAYHEKANQEFTALLAQRLLLNESDKMVTIAPDTARWLPNADLLREVYSVLAHTPWIETMTLSSALDKPKKTIGLKPVKNAPSADKGYLKALESSYRYVRDFSTAVPSTNKLRRRLEKQLYTAQSIDYLPGADDLIPAIGNIYLRDIRRTVAAEFAKIELAPPPRITFSSRSGKIPISIMNKAGYPMKARLHLSGKDFTFSDDTKEQVTLKPKENLISYHITAGFTGLSRLRVAVFIGERQITSNQIEVRVSNILRYLVMLGTTLLVLGAGVMIYLRGRS